MALTLLGAGLRLVGVGHFLANVDHAYPTAQAIVWLSEGQWPLLGQDTSIFFANPAGMSYLAAIPWLLFGSLWGAHLFSALLNVLAVPLTYRLARHVGGPAWGVAAASLVAFNPWVAQFSRAGWVQGLLPLWTSLTFTLLVLALFGPGGRPRLAGPRQAWRLAAALCALAGLTQMYLLAFLNLAPAALILLLNRRRLAARGLWLGLAVLALAVGLYGLALWSDRSNLSAQLARLLAPDQPLALQTTGLEHALRLVTGRDYELVYGNDGSPGWRARRVLSLSLSLALAAVVAAGVARAAWQVARRRPSAGLWAAALLWWLAPVAALTLTRHPVHIAYLLLSLPAGYLLAAPILAPLAASRARLLFGALLAINAFALVRAGDAHVAAHPVGGSLDELSVATARRFGRAAAALVDAYGLQEVYAPLDAHALTARVGRPLQAVSWAALPELQIVPLGRPALYVRLGAPTDPPLDLAQRADTLVLPNDQAILFDVIPALTRAQLGALPARAVEWPSAQGLTLVGYDPPTPGGTLRAYWLVEALAESRGEWLFAPYAKLLDAQGQVVASGVGLGLPGYYYRLGDVYLTPIELPDVAPGSYLLELGLYDGVHGLAATFWPPSGGTQPFYTAPLTIE